MKTLKFPKIFFIYYVTIVAFVLLRIASSVGAFSFLQDALLKSGFLTTIIQILILFLLPLLLYKTYTKQKFKDIFWSFDYKKISLKVVLYSILLGLLAYILNLIVATFFSAIITVLGYDGIRIIGKANPVVYDSVFKMLLGILFVAILPAFCEEFLHRGMILKGTSNQIGYKRALIISSVLFGLMHLNIEQVFYAIILGFVFGLVSIATKSIWPSVIMHFLNNGINVYFDYASKVNAFGGDWLKSLSEALGAMSSVQALLICFVCIAFLVFAMIWLFVLIFKQTHKEQLLSSKVLTRETLGIEDLDSADSRLVDMRFNAYFKQKFIDANSYLDVFLPRTEGDYKIIKPREKVYLVVTITMGVLITIFTFIWGAL